MAVRYAEEDGTRRSEQGEGHLRIETPSLVALSAGKVGQILFWLGCDAQRYWWFDLTGDQAKAFVGAHHGPGRGKGGLAAVVNPAFLPRLLGLEPINPDVVEVSGDKRLIGVTQKIDSGYVRLWLDPRTYDATKIEIWDEKRRPTLAADLGEYTNLELTAGGGNGPRVPTQIFIGHAASNTEVRLYLSGVSDGGKKWEPAAFEFDRLIGSLGARKVTDLDVPEGTTGRKGVLGTHRSASVRLISLTDCPVSAAMSRGVRPWSASW